MRDPLFRLIRRTQAAIADDLPKAFGLTEGELQRQDRPVIPLRVVREAVVNALMHRSYRSDAPVQIIRYANRLEIRNPGFSLKSFEHLGEPGSSPRNPKIAAVLHETRFAETKGSGIRVMRDLAEAAGLTPPLFESDRGRDQFVAQFLFHHLLGEDDLRWLAGFKAMNLTDADARALVVAREAGAINNATWRDINKTDPLTASQCLRRLRDLGLFEQQGKGSATWYRPTPRMLDRGPAASLPAVALDAGDDGLSPKPPGLSPRLQGVSPKPQGLPTHPPPQPPEPAEQKVQREAGLAELSPELAAQVAALGQRKPPHEVRAAILALCRQRPWRAEELATLLSRRVDTIRSDYLRPMVKEGLLALTNPEKASDPMQAYRTVEVER